MFRFLGRSLPFKLKRTCDHLCFSNLFVFPFLHCLDEQQRIVLSLLLCLLCRSKSLFTWSLELTNINQFIGIFSIIIKEIIVIKCWTIVIKTSSHRSIYCVMEYFFMHFCPGTMTNHAESINSDLQRGLDRSFTTHNIEHRTEPVSDFSV